MALGGGDLVYASERDACEVARAHDFDDDYNGPNVMNMEVFFGLHILSF